MSIFLDNASYNRIVTAIADIQPCPFAARVTPDQVKIVLGEVANIWPCEHRG